MDAFVRMPARDRRLACLLAEEAKSLQAASVEIAFDRPAEEGIDV